MQTAVDIRRSGSAALDLACLAAGRTDGYFEYSLNAWDFAAGALILSEAGGRVTDWQGRPVPLAKGPIAASNGKIHEALLAVLGKPRVTRIREGRAVNTVCRGLAQ